MLLSNGLASTLDSLAAWWRGRGARPVPVLETKARMASRMAPPVPVDQEQLLSMMRMWLHR